MRFARFGVTLERLERRHVERVRRWRNSESVRPYMRLRDRIDADQQVEWFEGLDETRDWYFFARLGSPLGLFHVKQIDWSTARGEAGGFVGDPSTVGTPGPALATLALMDFAFLVLGLERLEAQYNAGLRSVVRFNDQLGYRREREHADGFLRAAVSRRRYLEHAEGLRRAAARLYGSSARLETPGPWLAARLDGIGESSSSDLALETGLEMGPEMGSETGPERVGA